MTEVEIEEEKVNKNDTGIFLYRKHSSQKIFNQYCLIFFGQN